MSILSSDRFCALLEPDKSADTIAITGDPLNDVTVLKKVAFVMKNGKVHEDQR